MPTSPETLDLLSPGARVVVRDQEWQVESIQNSDLNMRAVVHCIGRSELVQGRNATFFSDLDEIQPEDPSQTRFELDTSPQGLATRLTIESTWRRAAVPVSNTDVLVGHRMLADDLQFQREPFKKAIEQIQPRILIADAVGLGKTLEVGLILSELQRRGRANRVLAVVPRHILDQIQHELWCRYAFPLVRLDSNGVQRLQQRIPSGRNPFAYYNRAIVSIDTLKQPGKFRHHLEQVQWDVVWFDESHKLANKNTHNYKLARVLAPNANALILSSATPHNGKAESFAELIKLLDPTAVPNPKQVEQADIEHLVVRRHKNSPDVALEIGHKWAARKEPKIISVTPTAEEERVLSLIARDWTGKTTKSEDKLFPYTLLKSALSSPKALEASIRERLKRHKNQGSGDEFYALTELQEANDAALSAGSAKLHALQQVLTEIGVGPRSDVRAVVFSERIATLDWIADALRRDLGMSDEQVVTFHNSKSDEEQQSIVEAFSMASAPVRVLVTSDIASEGVNLHKQCHHLIHADLPWSLITTTQRNGRIDRYGQEHPPEIRYLVYAPTESREVASDVHVLKKLIEKEHEAHLALGDSASIMNLHTESLEEKEIARVLREGDAAAKERAMEEVAPSPQGASLWSMLGLDDSENDVAANQATHTTPTPVRTSERPSLFTDSAAYLTEGLQWLQQQGTHVESEVDGAIVGLKPPDDLIRRLASLPQAYLKQRDLARWLRLTPDKTVADRSLQDALNAVAEAGEAGTAWPEVHYLGPQHPVLDWLSDKILFQSGRNTALALPADVEAPTVLISGLWTNRRGEAIAESWLAATIKGSDVQLAPMAETLDAAGVTSGMVNAGWDGDLKEVEAVLPAVLEAATGHLQAEMEQQHRTVQTQLDQTSRRLGAWQRSAEELAQQMKESPRKQQRLKEIADSKAQVEQLIAAHAPSDHPLVRVVGALLPRGRG